ncbi:MAG: hypothetical protein ACI8ZM_005662 [Crocinitomix sp.]|jgi:hypothetical protein
MEQDACDQNRSQVINPNPSNDNSTFTAIDNLDDFNFSIRPNPASNYLTVSLPANFENGQISVIDISGNVDYESNVVNESDNETRISIADLEKGISLIRITKDGYSQELLFVKE